MNKNLPLMSMFYLISLMGMISSNNWFMFWIFMEMNSLCFIPLMLIKKTKKGGEASLLYFIVQGISSMFLLMAMINEESSLMDVSEPNSSLITVAFLKMGAGVFFNWLFLLSFSITLSILLLILTLQKLSGFFLLLLSQAGLSYLMLIFIFLSSFMAMFINMKQNLFKSMLTVSSLSNTSWLLTAVVTTYSGWMFYFAVYSFSLVLSSTMNNKYLDQNYRNSDTLENPLLFLSMGGLPPMPGFFPKILILMNLSYSRLSLLSIFLLLAACVDIFIYLRFSFTSALKNNGNLMYCKAVTTKSIKMLSLSAVTMVTMMAIML
ncbi:NADH dehydrogenase subunit 2 (mitochondrion) [Ramazzottius varieornatus]|uniref:NADH-ubiquinone oxidoreductase chain 2 n=1 Tax=Ramazzottius varieornatus TaxID=947166 RepID=A0A1C9ZP79_RAMVA|nr:NADH dehydrogenase subunit 2 [Ramazzottius varieornatus]BAV58173.1 NADH dehydrogenase subunit 2 [Ramazzottius varieornatus]